MSLLGLILLSLGMGLAAWLGFYWSVKSGQYDDPEGPKYRMLEDDDEPPRQDRPAPAASAAPGAIDVTGLTSEPGVAGAAEAPSADAPVPPPPGPRPR